MNMVEVLSHGLLIFLAAFGLYWLEMTGKKSSGALLLLLVLPILGVYILSWWALLTYICGLFLGAKFFIQEINRE
jgi:hypothetical protein